MAKVHIAAEIGINHNGSVEEARRLIRAAADSGVDSVKFQKRTPRDCVPREEWDRPKATPWGETLPYIEYRERMEFSREQFEELWELADACGVKAFFSVWDHGALDFAAGFPAPFIKIPSAKLTDLALVKAAGLRCGLDGRDLILSSGMSTAAEIGAGCKAGFNAIQEVGHERQLWLLHCHSAYPAPTRELNLRVISRWRDMSGGPEQGRYFDRVGYSGHELGTAPTEWAVALGAEMVERHITLDKTAVGSDHQASLTPEDFRTMCRRIRSLEEAMGDGRKRVWPSEEPARRKLRGADD